MKKYNPVLVFGLTYFLVSMMRDYFRYNEFNVIENIIIAIGATLINAGILWIRNLDD